MPELGPFASSFRVRLAELDAAKTPLHPLYGLRFIKRGIKELTDANVRAALAQFQQKPVPEQDTYELLKTLETLASQWREQQEATGKLTLGASATEKTKSQLRKEKIKQKKEVQKQAAAILASAGIGGYPGNAKGSNKGKINEESV